MARTKYTHTCPQCGEKFVPHRERQRCCSKSCGATLRRREAGQQLDRVCQYCGSPFTTRASFIAKGGGKFCSRFCSYISQCKPRPHRRGAAHRMWGEAVMRRDGFACRACGKREDLNAHHVKPWADNPELRYSVENGVTLCWRCHQLAHGHAPKLETFSPQRQ